MHQGARRRLCLRWENVVFATRLRSTLGAETAGGGGCIWWQQLWQLSSHNEQNRSVVGSAQTLGTPDQALLDQNLRIG